VTVVGLRRGQKWRDVSGLGAQIITVERVDGESVHGAYAPEDAPGTVGTSVWSVRAFERMDLIFDPEWPKHRVVVPGVYDQDDVLEALGRVGTVQGMQSMTMSPSTAPRLWLDVIAPNEATAIDRVRAAVGHFERVEVDGIHVNNRVPQGG
jgi:hypothetical protein